MHLNLPESVIVLFRAAGWPLSKAGSEPSVPAEHPAVVVLSELSGLTVGDCGAGIECARSDIAFERDDRLEQDEVIQQWAYLMKTRLVCIGGVHNFHAVLLMDSSGACYQSSLIHEAFSFEGESFGVAVERILLGRKGEPMLRPEQSSVSMYGETIKSGHPSLFRYQDRAAVSDHSDRAAHARSDPSPSDSVAT
jgi:hypothetical protein